MQNRASIKAIQAFEAAARLSSFASAAEELFVSPSAISHQIKLLEAHVGVKLFHRVHRSVVLTDAGRKLAEEASAAFVRLARALQAVSRAEKTDILTIHSAPSIAAQWLMPRLARFSAMYPDTDVRLNASTDIPDLVNETVDIDIRYGSTRIQPQGAMVVPFPMETVVPLCAPQLTFGADAIRTVEDLRRHTLIHSEAGLIKWRDWLAPFKKLKIDIQRGPRFDRSFMAINAAVDGLGVCLESLLLVERELEAGKLVAPFGFDGPTVSGYRFIVMRSRAELPKIQRFQKWLFEELEASLAGRQT